jgi:hypothetical protein
VAVRRRRRPTLEAFARWTHQQGVCARHLEVEALFAEGALETGIAFGVAPI